MFGFLIGTLSLIGLIKVVRHGGGWGDRGGWRHGGPRNWMLRRLFQRLDTTPGQEKVIAQAFDSLHEKGRAIRDEAFRSRSTFGQAFKGEHFDSAAVNAAFEKQQAALDEMKKAMLEAMQSVHEALTPEQRAEAGDLLEFGPGGYGQGRCGGGRGRWSSHGRFASRGGDQVNV